MTTADELDLPPLCQVPHLRPALAALCVTQPRMNDLLRGRVSQFSLDALVNIATAMGREVHFELQAA